MEALFGEKLGQQPHRLHVIFQLVYYFIPTVIYNDFDPLFFRISSGNLEIIFIFM